MFSKRDKYIHQMSANKIRDLLQFHFWSSENQSISSSITNDNCLQEPSEFYAFCGENTSGPNAFSDIAFGKNVQRVLDIGGGKSNCNQDFLRRRANIELLIWDPYNRNEQHNAMVKESILQKPADSVTSMSVLNVIPELESRLVHINTVKAALLNGKKAYFKIWPGEAPLKRSYIASETLDAYQANAGADRFLREIELAFGQGNARCHPTIPNLIVAIKRLDCLPTIADIAHLQQLSQQDYLAILEIQSNFIQFVCHCSLHYFIDGALFKHWLQEFLIINRSYDKMIQTEYDKHFALTIR